LIRGGIGSGYPLTAHWYNQPHGPPAPPARPRRSGIPADFTLRFRARRELESSLAAPGYQVLEVREARDSPGHEFVFVAQRTA
jgi:hypothetical protein